MQRLQATEDKKRERLIQSALEYWKANYEFQKHLTLITLTATAGFIALLSGFFGGPGEWVIENSKGNIFIVVIFTGFWSRSCSPH